MWTHTNTIQYRIAWFSIILYKTTIFVISIGKVHCMTFVLRLYDIDTKARQQNMILHDSSVSTKIGIVVKKNYQRELLNTEK